VGRKTSGRNKEGRVVFHDHNGFRVLTNEKENFVITASFLKQRDNPKTAVPMMKQRPSSEILGSRSSAVSFVSEHEDQELYEERSTSFQSRQGNKVRFENVYDGNVISKRKNLNFSVVIEADKFLSFRIPLQ